MTQVAYHQRYRIWETDYGRDAGWILELRGEPIAILSDCRNDEMFWDTYQLDIMTAEEQLREAMMNNSFWNQVNYDELLFRNREFAITIHTAFFAGDPFVEPRRLKVRGLYIAIEPPSLWDKVKLWFHKHRGSDTIFH